MSGSSTPGSKPAKTMSSRLLTMKFMQRAAASSSPAVEEPETPSPKRQRLSANNTPETPNSDLEAVQAALAAEEQKRQDAIARQAAEAGESNWVLNFSNSDPAAPASPVPAYPSRPKIVAADSLDTETQGVSYGGRKSFGNYKPKKSRDMFDNSENEPIDPSDPQQVEAMMEKVKRDADKKTRKSEVRLDKLTSISGGRSATMDVRGKGNGGKKKMGGKKRSK